MNTMVKSDNKVEMKIDFSQYPECYRTLGFDIDIVGNGDEFKKHTYYSGNYFNYLIKTLKETILYLEKNRNYIETLTSIRTSYELALKQARNLS